MPYVPKQDPEHHLREVTERSRSTSAVSLVTEVRERALSSKPPPGTAGFVALRTKNSALKRPVGHVALRAGVLIGRYERCDFNGQHIEMDMEVSRVHALLLSLDGRIHLFDTGSTNGITIDDVPIDRLALPRHHPTTFQLSDTLEVTWVPVEDAPAT
jgi:hypothetical protein